MSSPLPPDASQSGSTNGMPVRMIPYKWELLVLLWIAFTFNQADRQIYNNLLPLIQPDLQLSDAQAGLVATIFTAIYGLLVPISGYAGDAFRRKWVIVGALALWSTATLLTGLAGGIIGLIIFRGLATGAGEAFYYPSANSLDRAVTPTDPRTGDGNSPDSQLHRRGDQLHRRIRGRNVWLA